MNEPAETAGVTVAPLFWRKKPVTIQAVRFLGIFDGAMRFDANPVPDWLTDATGQPEGEEGSVYIGYNTAAGVPELRVSTLEGAHTASPGDWIIQGVKLELYPCKPDIFAATYDVAVDDREGVEDNWPFGRSNPVMPELASYVGGDGRVHSLPAPESTTKE